MGEGSPLGQPARRTRRMHPGPLFVYRWRKGEEIMRRRTALSAIGAAAAGLLLPRPNTARAEPTPGVTAAEIKIGNTMPYSGPASSYGIIGRCDAAFFRMVNDQSGIAGRKITFI